MPIFNVAVAVIDLVDAASGADALDAFRARLTAAGFEAWPHPLPDGADAFEAEEDS